MTLWAAMYSQTLSLLYAIAIVLFFLQQSMASLISANKVFGDHTPDAPINQRGTPYYFTVQAYMDLSEWLSLLTLCLFPLVAHIFAGVPEPTVLQDPRPGWSERICHFNPTSIYWRYYAINLRLSRVKSWEPVDMASTSAVFWRGDILKWDGSEQVMTESRNFCTRRPTYHRNPLLSASTMKTVVVSLQGIQALYDLARGLRLGGYALTVALPNIFRPLAVAGLFRLLPSFWLTDEYGYANISSDRALILKLTASEHNSAPPQLYPENCWRAILVKIFFLGATTSLLVLSLIYFNPNSRVTAGTASTLGVNIFYVIFLFVTFVTISAYTETGQSNTTIIPCISSTWYKIYTYLVFLLALVVLIVTALETRRTSCGQYTTYPGWAGFDYFLCPDK